MRVVGIVAEYNPLHKGHLRHLALTKERAGEDACVVVCMSGNWVQRGECAVADKWTRARWAVQNGADLVLELPSVFALASAETFARGAVTILTAAGITHLSFGCETPDLSDLKALAAALDAPGFPTALRPYLDQGLSYPAAREKALADQLGPSAAQRIGSPNNNLAVEYLRAISVDIIPIPISREGDHDGPITQEYPSASALRQLLREGDITSAIPHLASPWEGPVYDIRHLERSILCKLRQLSPEELGQLPDAGDGLAQRLWKAAREAASLEQLYALAKTKRLTHARLRRVTLWAALGLTGADRPAAPEYLRVLAMNRRGTERLAAIRETCPLPVITKSADYKKLLATEARLTDLFSLCAPTPLPCGQEWRRSPAVI